jgi:hypothetical protein
MGARVMSQYSERCMDRQLRGRLGGPRSALGIALPLVALVLLAGCQSAPENKDHADCRRAWVKAFNVIFDNSISPTDVRWMHACMEKRGYKRVYDVGRCGRLEASIREAACYEKAGAQVEANAQSRP